jgi:hypothetical protein
MTTVFERTRSVIETSGFLLRLSHDKSLPDAVRNEASQLLRHYPTPEAVRLAGRCEAIRQDEVSKLAGSPRTLHPAIATWPLLEPFFCDATIHDLPEPIVQPDLSTTTAIRRITCARSESEVAGPQILVLAAPTGMGCLSTKYRCFTSAREQVLLRAAVVLGSPARARNWFVNRIRSLDRRQPCTLMNTVQDFTLVMDTLFRIEYGLYW